MSKRKRKKESEALRSPICTPLRIEIDPSARHSPRRSIAHTSNRSRREVLFSSKAQGLLRNLYGVVSG